MIRLSHINVPEGWESQDDWDSHLPALYLAVNHLEKGNLFIELGSGFGSTPTLSYYCNKHSITFVSFDTDNEWAAKTGATFISDFINLNTRPVDCIFIDGKPGEQRKELISSWANDAKVIVVHDSEIGANYVYGMADVLSTFKYRINYEPIGKPHTTLVSNHINIEKWINHQG